MERFMKAFRDAIYSFFFLLGISFTLWLLSLIVYLCHSERDILQAWYFHEFFLFLLLFVDSIIVVGLARYRGLKPLCPIAMACLAIILMFNSLGSVSVSSQRMRSWLENDNFYCFGERLFGFLFFSAILNLGYSAAVLDEGLHPKPVGGEGGPLTPSEKQ